MLPINTIEKESVLASNDHDRQRSRKVRKRERKLYTSIKSQRMEDCEQVIKEERRKVKKKDRSLAVELLVARGDSLLKRCKSFTVVASTSKKTDFPKQTSSPSLKYSARSSSWAAYPRTL